MLVCKTALWVAGHASASEEVLLRGAAGGEEMLGLLYADGLVLLTSAAAGSLDVLPAAIFQTSFESLNTIGRNCKEPQPLLHPSAAPQNDTLLPTSGAQCFLSSPKSGCSPVLSRETNRIADLLIVL